jgi:hypothetical protein
MKNMWHENVWNTGIRYICDMGRPLHWNLSSVPHQVSLQHFIKVNPYPLAKSIAKKIEKLNGWLEVSNELYGQPSLNASFNYKDQAVKFAIWYDKQF